jgi:hypothetical protein
MCARNRRNRDRPSAPETRGVQRHTEPVHASGSFQVALAWLQQREESGYRSGRRYGCADSSEHLT